MSNIDALAEQIRRNRFIPIPPADRNFVSPQRDDFIGQGILQLRELVQAGLRPAHSVLDVGSGIGRLALPLTQYLDPNANYFGIDVNLSGVAWCHENITQVYPNFDFAIINAHNPHYRNRYASGQESATVAAWPIPSDRKFDYACAFSLFTHIVWDETERYMREIATRLKPRGVVLATWFLIDDAARDGIARGVAFRDFDVSSPGPTHLVKDYKHPAISHEANAVLGLVDRLGFDVIKDERGGWRTNTGGQDHMILRART